VGHDALFVPEPLPSWGLWPATLVAMAIEAGASRVALLGVDLGTAMERPGLPERLGGVPLDPAQMPVAAVLALLSRLSPIVTLDCGAGGATKRGWLKASLDEAAGSALTGPCELLTHPAAPQGERLLYAQAQLDRMNPVISRARALMTAAEAARDNGGTNVSTLHESVADIMAWRDDHDIRIFAQECLGLAFLPRLWRTGIDLSLGGTLWRPLMLATHELVRQADALAAAARTARAA
jgi:hypothetical protein